MRALKALILTLVLTALPAVASELYLTVQPVDVCDDSGAHCAGDQLFSDITNAIWAQAGITVDFLSMETIDSTLDYSGTALTDTFLNDPVALASHFGIDYVYYLPVAVVADAFGSNVLGEGYVGEGLAIISDGSFEFPSVLAHELGHTLGLSHILTPGDYLMSPVVSTDDVDETVSDIFPVGDNDQLTSDEITLARQSALLSDTAPTPEPATWLLSLGGLATLALGGKRSARARG